MRGLVARAENPAGSACVENRRGWPAGVRRLASRLRRVAAAYLVVTALGTSGNSTASAFGPGPKASWTGRAGAAASWWQPDGRRAVVHEVAAAPRGIGLQQVAFDGRGAWPDGPEAVRGYLEEALTRIGITEAPARDHWIEGMMTIADHEAQFHSNAINLSDSNAYGPTQPDGGPLHATRGPWQMMPDTFAAFHQPGTSNSAWDPVAAACASINYQMSRYGVNRDGSNQRMLVGQANPGIRQGY
ncbi:transglycosylase [Mycobacterium sp. M23085]|uniref:transglycosylase n=1 Tax=Mycobacterium sp. M23085 TaxID=3378087 RepID=UPI003877C633